MDTDTFKNTSCENLLKKLFIIVSIISLTVIIYFSKQPILSAIFYILATVSFGCTIQEFTGENKVARNLESSKQSVKVLRKRRYKLLKTAKPFSKEAAEIRELEIKIEELDNKIAKLKTEVTGEHPKNKPEHPLGKAGL